MEGREGGMSVLKMTSARKSRLRKKSKLKVLYFFTYKPTSAISRDLKS